MTATVAILPGGDRFEDFFDKIGVSIETFRDEFTGGWLFNYIHALRATGVRAILLFTSARVRSAIQFTHADTGATVWILPSPHTHRRVRRAQQRFFPQSRALGAAASYVGLPWRAFAAVLRQERCDAILCQEYEHPRFDLCVFLGRRLAIPVFATYQGANQTGTALEQPFRRHSVRQCAGLVIPAHTEIARVQNAYAVTASKIGVIPNPVEMVPHTDVERRAARASLNIGPDTRVVAWHGRVQIETKGLDVLLDAWDRICAERPHADILLLLVGTGRNADRLQRRIAGNARVRWIDRYVFSRQELWSHLLAADLYTIPSRREGFAVAVLEAMACGLPVVASDVSGVAEIVPGGETDGGIKVPPGEAVPLAAALLRLMDQPALARRLGDAASGRVEREYSLQVVGPKLKRFLFPEGGREHAG